MKALNTNVENSQHSFVSFKIANDKRFQLCQRVYRVLGFLSSRPNRGPPPPHTQANVPSRLVLRGNTRLRERGWLGPDSDEGTESGLGISVLGEVGG
jgi:hypothetical protein